jgi:hypothetical protein
MTSACTGGDGEPGEPAKSAVPREFAATFEVESPIAVVAGDSKAWVLTQQRDGDGLSVLRVDHTGHATDVLRRPGVATQMLPYLDGVVVASVACAAQRCEETVGTVVVLDSNGSVLAEDELAREPGDLETAGGAKLEGVSGDTVWIDTPEGPTVYEPDIGQAGTARPDSAPSEWTPAPHRVDLREYQRPPDIAVAPEPVALGYGDQAFVLVSDGVIRRVVGPPRAPKSEETLEVPADIFFQPYDATANLYFDTSATVVAGCIRQSGEWPVARCYIGSP